MGQLGNLLKVGHVVPGIADALDVHGLGLVVDSGRQLLGIVPVDKLGRDAEPREGHLELVVGAAVQVRRRHDVVARLCERGNGKELGRLAGRRGYCSHTALESRDTLFQDVDGRLVPSESASAVGGANSAYVCSVLSSYVPYPRVDVASLLEAEQPRAVGRVIEDEALARPTVSACRKRSPGAGADEPSRHR